MKKEACFTYLFIFLLLAVGCSQPAEKGEMQSFHPTCIKLKEGPFKEAQQTDLDYILALDPDRLLAPYLKDAGLEPKKENYGNWENTGLDGHIGGHYLSALALMYVATDNEILRERLDYMLDELERCQKKNGNGYVGGIPGGRAMWEEIAKGEINAGTFSLNKKWVPLYNIHKTFAGLYDAYYLTGSEKAKKILIALTDWCYQTTKNLTDEQIQTMLKSEHGGMNDVFVDVAQLTGDERYMQMAKRFSHNIILDPLLKGENKLTGLHANTQIPKVIGFEKYAIANKQADWAKASEFFWENVTNDWTISIGGNSVREHFHPANDFTSMIESEQGPETCNTYNMLKLTRLLFLDNPEGKFIDYYERALFNHILSSQHPKRGGFVYFTPMRPQHYRVYSQPQTSFWCCVGSGLENPGRFSEMIYAHTNNELYVNLFLASELDWKEKGVKLIQDTKFPQEESTTFTIETESPKKFAVKLRMPKWLESGCSLKINGEKKEVETDKHGYATISREWKSGDVIDFDFKMKTVVEYMPDGSPWVSFVHGPIVLGAVTDTTNLDGLWADDSRMGHVAKGKKYSLNTAPTIIAEDSAQLAKLIQPIDSLPLGFSISGLKNTDKKLVLQPFYQIHEARYMVYWPVFTPESFQEKQAELAQKEKEIEELNQKTIDLVWPGEQQPEADHFVKFEDSESGVFRDRHWRHARGFFSYQFKNPGKQESVLRVTYFGANSDRKFNILINNEIIATVKLDGTLGNDFVDVNYQIPQAAIQKSKGKTMEVKFMAEKGSIAGGVFGVRLMKAE